MTEQDPRRYDGLVQLPSDRRIARGRPLPGDRSRKDVLKAAEARAKKGGK